MILGKEHEVWRNNRMESFTSTPVYNANRIYCTIKRGELICLDAEILANKFGMELAPDQIHASPTMAGDTLLYRCLMEKFSL